MGKSIHFIPLSHLLCMNKSDILVIKNLIYLIAYYARTMLTVIVAWEKSVGYTSIYKYHGMKISTQLAQRHAIILQ